MADRLARLSSVMSRPLKFSTMAATRGDLTLAASMAGTYLLTCPVGASERLARAEA